MGITISHFEDPYGPISTMDCHKGFERCSLFFALVAYYQEQIYCNQRFLNMKFQNFKENHSEIS